MLKTKFWTPDETWVKPHQSCGVIAVFNTQELLLFQLLTKVKEKLLLISLPVSQGKSPKFAYFMLETSSFKKTFEVLKNWCSSFTIYSFFFSFCSIFQFYPNSILFFLSSFQFFNTFYNFQLVQISTLSIFTFFSYFFNFIWIISNSYFFPIFHFLSILNLFGSISWLV